MARRPALAERSHEWLLRAYPQAYRRRFGEEMTAHFLHELDEARAAGGMAPTLLWVRTAWDAFRIGAGEHLRRFAPPLRRDTGAGIRQGVRAPRAGRPAKGQRSHRPDPTDQLRGDVRFALRGLRRDPTFAVTAILTLALGIGGSATVLSVIDAVFLRPLPYESPERLVSLSWDNPRTGEPFSRALAPGVLADIAERSRIIDELATVQSLYDRDLNLSGAATMSRVDADWVSTNFFDVLGAEPALGRGFVSEDGERGATDAAVLSHTLWSTAFSGDPAAVGRSMRLNGQPYTVVGVMPPEFGFVRDDGGTAALWLADEVLPASRDDRSNYLFRPVARIREGVTISQVQAEMDAIVQDLSNDFPRAYTAPWGESWRIGVTPLHEEIVAGYRLPIFLVAGAVGLLLVIVWINAGNLLLSRTVTRSGELSLRVAIGAGRLRIARQLVTEALVLSLLGGALGLVVTWTLLETLAATAPPVAGGATGLSSAAIPLMSRAEVNVWVGWTTLLTCIVTAGACALGPVMHFLRRQPLVGLKRGYLVRQGRGLGGQLLASAQMSLAMVLLIGAALLLTTMVKVSEVPLGFQPSDALVMRVELAPERYGVLDGEPHDRTAVWTLSPDRTNLVRNVVGRLRGLPSVRAVGAATTLPFQAGRRHFAGIHFLDSDYEVWQVLDGVEMHGSPAVVTATPAYPEALGLPLVSGRAFSDRDTRNSPGVVIVNELFVDSFGLEAPLGQRMLLRDGTEWREVEIVGVVGNARPYGYPENSLADARAAPSAQEEVLVPFEQAPSEFQSARMAPQMTLNLVLRHEGDPDELATAMRSVMLEADPSTPLVFVDTMEGYLAESLKGRRFQLLLMAGLGILSLVLTLIGIYGVVASQASRRVREMGIRVALGARSGQVTGLLLGESARFTALGVLGGIAGAMLVTRFLSPWLYETSPTDPGTFAGLSFLMSAVALLACWLPARRAARVDPVESIRSE